MAVPFGCAPFETPALSHSPVCTTATKDIYNNYVFDFFEVYNGEYCKKINDIIKFKDSQN